MGGGFSIPHFRILYDGILSEEMELANFQFLILGYKRLTNSIQTNQISYIFNSSF